MRKWMGCVKRTWQEMDGTLRAFEMYAAKVFLSVVLANDRVNIQTPVKPHTLSTRGRERLERIRGVKRSWEKRREGEPRGARGTRKEAKK